MPFIFGTLKLVLSTKLEKRERFRCCFFAAAVFAAGLEAAVAADADAPSKEVSGCNIRPPLSNLRRLAGSGLVAGGRSAPFVGTTPSAARFVLPRDGAIPRPPICCSSPCSVTSASSSISLATGSSVTGDGRSAASASVAMPLSTGVGSAVFGLLREDRRGDLSALIAGRMRCIDGVGGTGAL